jgi:hypothetical protein
VLEKRRLIRCRKNVNDRRRGNDMPSYRVPMEVINSVRKGIEYKPEKRENLTIEECFEVLGDLFSQRIAGELSYESFLNDLRDLFNDNMHLKFSQTIEWRQRKR